MQRVLAICHNDEHKHFKCQEFVRNIHRTSFYYREMFIELKPPIIIHTFPNMSCLLSMYPKTSSQFLIVDISVKSSRSWNIMPPSTCSFSQRYRTISINKLKENVTRKEQVTIHDSFNKIKMINASHHLLCESARAFTGFYKSNFKTLFGTFLHLELCTHSLAIKAYLKDLSTFIATTIVILADFFPLG